MFSGLTAPALRAAPKEGNFPGAFCSVGEHETRPYGSFVSRGKHLLID